MADVMIVIGAYWWAWLIGLFVPFVGAVLMHVLKPRSSLRSRLILASMLGVVACISFILFVLSLAWNFRSVIP